MKFKWMSLVSIPAVVAVIVPVCTLSSCGAKSEKVIVDTDVGNDCDDIAALTVLGNAYKKKMVDVVAVTVCNQYLPSFHATDIMLEKYGIDCPMGYSDNDQPVVIPEGKDYAKAIDDKWTARSEKDESRRQQATQVLRRALANNKGKKIKLITLGMLNNIDNLLRSGPDTISPKTGKELFYENVSEMVIMGGNFVNQTWTEFNIYQALDAAKRVINETPDMPKTFLDWTAGKFVKTGLTFYAHPDSPQCVAYWTYTDGDVRESWDPLTMYIALNGAWKYSNMGDVTVVGEGQTIFNENKEGKCRYVLVYPDSNEIAAKLESWYSIP